MYAPDLHSYCSTVGENFIVAANYEIGFGDIN